MKHEQEASEPASEAEECRKCAFRKSSYFLYVHTCSDKLHSIYAVRVNRKERAQHANWCRANRAAFLVCSSHQPFPTCTAEGEGEGEE